MTPRNRSIEYRGLTIIDNPLVVGLDPYNRLRRGGVSRGVLEKSSERWFYFEPIRLSSVRSGIGRGFVNRGSWVRICPGSLFSFFELPLTHGFTQRGVWGCIAGGVVFSSPARRCNDRLLDRDLSVVPETAPISKIRPAHPSSGLRTLSVSRFGLQRFKTPFGTANRTQP